VGLDPASHAGHSLRSGFLTSAAEAGASIWKLSEVSCHKSLDTLRGYVRRGGSICSRSTPEPRSSDASNMHRIDTEYARR
jgi:hypothetical protein